MPNTLNNLKKAIGHGLLGKSSPTGDPVPAQPIVGVLSGVKKVIPSKQNQHVRYIGPRTHVKSTAIPDATVVPGSNNG